MVCDEILLQHLCFKRASGDSIPIQEHGALVQQAEHALWLCGRLRCGMGGALTMFV